MSRKPRLRSTATVAALTALAVSGAAVAVAASLGLTSATLGANNTPVTIAKRTPTASTPTFTPASPVTAGTSVVVSTTFTGGTSATTGSFGAVTLAVFPVADVTCAGSPTSVATASTVTAGLDGDVYTAQVSPSVGSYRIVARYAGDARNNAYTQACGSGGSLTVTAGAALYSTKGVATDPHFQAMPGDTVSVTFAAAINPDTVCKGWTGAVYAQSLLNNAFTATITRSGSGTSATNVLSFSGRCPGQPTSETLHIGTVNLGNANYVTSGSLSFEGTGSNATSILLSSDGKTLSVTLGSSKNPSLLVPSTAVGTATFTTDPVVKTTTGLAATSGQVSVGLLF